MDECCLTTYRHNLGNSVDGKMKFVKLFTDINKVDGVIDK